MSRWYCKLIVIIECACDGLSGTRGGQRTTWSWYSPSMFAGVWEMYLGLSGLCNKGFFFPLSHSDGPRAYVFIPSTVHGHWATSHLTLFWKHLLRTFFYILVDKSTWLLLWTKLSHVSHCPRPHPVTNSYVEILDFRIPECDCVWRQDLPKVEQAKGSL